MVLVLEEALRSCLNGHDDDQYRVITLEQRGEFLELMSCWRYFRLHNHRLLLVRGVDEMFVRGRVIPSAQKIQNRPPDLVVPGWDDQGLILLLGFSVWQVVGAWPDPERKPTSVLAWQMC